MSDWYSAGLEDDMRPRMFEACDAGAPFALATVVSAEGGPRPPGSQMVVTQDAYWGFVSGGCIEGDVALHGRETLRDGQRREIVYGRGSPWIDARLPCGGRLDLLVERVAADDPALRELRRLTAARSAAVWTSDGLTRRCAETLQPTSDEVLRTTFLPRQRLAVVGSDPFAMAIAGLGASLGWETLLIRPWGPETPPPLPVGYSRRPATEALDALGLDTWTAVAVATHDLDDDGVVLAHALRSEAGYVGVLGSRRRVPERQARLRSAGLDEAAVSRLHAPIGLPIAARTPHEVALSVLAEIVAAKHEARASRAEAA